MQKPQTLLIYILMSMAIIIRVSHAAENANSNKIVIMTLEQVIEQALKANHKIIISEIDVLAADEARKEAFTGFLPRAETRYAFTRKSEPDWVRFKGDNKRYIIGTQDNYGWTTSAIQDLFKGFSILASYQIARLKFDVAKIRRDETRLDIILEARK